MEELLFYGFLLFAINAFTIIPSVCFDGVFHWKKIKTAWLITNVLLVLIILLAENFND
ncbi:MAG: hypothetical protein M1119_11070 [Firmicutes bacterium]|nr:hypothetical protein [Bacillota bacterium]